MELEGRSRDRGVAGHQSSFRGSKRLFLKGLRWKVIGGRPASSLSLYTNAIHLPT